MNEPTNISLVAMSIGPVQDFIASARRCRDLWFGSWVLSELAKACAAGACAATGQSVDALVFPGATTVQSLSPGSTTSVANKLLLRIQGDLDAAAAVAEAGRRSMAARLDELAGAAFERAGDGDPERDRHFHEETAWLQVRDLIEFTWAAVLQGPDYAHARRRVERLLAGRRGTKVWGQPGWADGVPKSSLDGVRESVLDERLFGRKPALPPTELRRAYGAHAAERLCGVGVLKRLGGRLGAGNSPRGERFFSTSHLAAIPYLRGAAGSPEAVGEWFDRVATALGSGLDRIQTSPRVWGPFDRLDGALLFEGRLPGIAEEAGCADPAAAAGELAGARADLLRAAGNGEPVPYYCILLADGDRMGALIDATADFRGHRDLSLALEEFATEAGTIVEAHDGSLVYSGGDDVLALLPLHLALTCADELRRSFAEHMGAHAAPGTPAPTLSVGLAVAHHIEPLEQALAAARRAEALAKELRNALAVVLTKRSGSPIEVSGGWEDTPSLHDRLLDYADLHRVDAVPDRVGFQLRELEALATEGGVPEALVTSEAIRMLRRKQPEQGTKARIAGAILQRLESQAVINPVALGEELVIARLLADVREQAGLEFGDGEDA